MTIQDFIVDITNVAHNIKNKIKGFFTTSRSGYDEIPDSNGPVELAKAKPVYANVGHIQGKFKLFGLFNIKKNLSSAVYIGDGNVLSATHVFHGNRYAIKGILQFNGYTFKTDDISPFHQSEYKIVSHESDPDDTDLTFATLESPIPQLSALSINYSTSIENNCVVVGFGLNADRDGTWTTKDDIKRAFKVPNTVPAYENSYRFNVIGYNIDLNDDNDYVVTEREYSKIESGISPGMSGGALFDASNNLVGIASGVIHRPFLEKDLSRKRHWENKSFFWSFSSVVAYLTPLPTLGLSPETGERHYWCNLFHNKEWIEEKQAANLQSNTL